ncbi:MAG TPA: hypothetical protein DF427_04090 [Moraxellaceae bacterium]|nr:hypothetical protein [Moraxellaceae bacterium]
MRHLKALVGAALALTMAACSNPQFIIHPSSNPTATQTRQQLDSLVETTTFKPLRMGSFLFPNKGEFFRPLIPTDSRNAIVYVYRPQSDWADQEVQSPGFFLNGQFLSGLKSGSYFWFEVPASQYYFNAKRPLAVVYLKTIFEAEFFFEGNKSYYFRYDEENPGPKKAVPGTAMLVVGPLHQMPDAQAIAQIRETRVMGVGRVILADEQPAWAPFDFYADAMPVDVARMDATSPRVKELRSAEAEFIPVDNSATSAADGTAPDAEAAPVAPKPESDTPWWNPSGWF